MGFLKILKNMLEDIREFGAMHYVANVFPALVALAAPFLPIVLIISAAISVVLLIYLR